MCNTTKNKEEYVYQTAEELQVKGEVHDKIEDAKSYFKDIRKTGKNTYQNYKYLESHDIFPVVRRVCEDFELRTRFTWNLDNITLTIIDKKDKSSEQFTIPVPTMENIEDPDKYMKAVGKVQTYAMRYLYIQAFEIATSDKIDKGYKQFKTTYTNGEKIRPTSTNAEPVDQTTLNTQSRDTRDIARTITEEMAEKGIETTDSNIYEYAKEKWQKQQISPDEFREIKQKLCI